MNNFDCHDRIILLSSGWYGGVAPEMIGLSNEEWIEKSITIRMYHEITHFVCRSRHPENIDVIRDEVFADMIGMIVAFGYYDADMAKMLLGIKDEKILENARVRYYLKNDNDHSVSEDVRFWTSWFVKKLGDHAEEDINNIIINVFEETLGVECLGVLSDDS